MVGWADPIVSSYVNLRSIAEIAPKVGGEHFKIDALAWKKEQDSVISVIVVGGVFTTVRHVWGLR
jgi:hypothetical protein